MESAVNTLRRPLVSAERNNGIATTTRRSRPREVSSRYKSPTPPPPSTSTTNSRRYPSPNLTRNVNASTTQLGSSKRAISAERKRPSTPPSPSRPSTPVSDTSVDSQSSSKKMINNRLPEVLWPSTMRSLSVSFQSDNISIPVSKKEKPVSHALSDRTLKSSSNVAHRQSETASALRKVTPERKISPLKGKNSSHQSENSRPIDGAQARLIDHHRWPSRGGGKLSTSMLTKSVDLSDSSGKSASFPHHPISGLPSLRRLSAEGIPRPLHKTSSDASQQSEFEDYIGAMGPRMKSVDDSLLRASAIRQVNSLSLSEKAILGPPSDRSRSLPRSRLPSPSRASVSKGTPSPSKTRPSTPTQSRGTSPSRIRQSSPTRQASSTASVLCFVADIKKGKKTNQLEDAHKLRLLYNRQLQWRFANARADAALYIQKIITEQILYNVWETNLELWDSVLRKRIELQRLNLDLKLNLVLREQFEHRNFLDTMLGNGVIGMLSETCNKWERRAALTPAHCARLLHSGKVESGATRIIIQPSTKRIYHDSLYEEVGCEVSEDLSKCGLIVGVKQPKLEMILPDRSYAFFSHTHKAQKENMPLLDKILAERSTLYDYELIVGDNGKRLLAFGIYAGRAGMIDFLHGLGLRYLSYGYSTPFLSLGASYMYPSLAASKAAVISVGEEISTLGLPSGICPLVFVFTGSGNVSQGAQEILKLLPHTFVEPSRLSKLFEADGEKNQHPRVSKRAFQVYGCVVTSKDMVEPKDPNNIFNKADYYSHPEHYTPVFHEKIAPYASVIVNCMYWEPRFPRLLTNNQLQDIMNKRRSLVGIADITCDIEGSIEFVNQATTIDSPFFRFDPFTDSYHNDMDGNGVICSAVDILPTEFAKEASQHFGNILSQFVGHLASTKAFTDLPTPLRLACIVHMGKLTSLYEYIPRMRESASDKLSEALPESHPNKKKHALLVSLNGHLFDDFLINEALDKIEAAGGTFRLVKCHVGQSADVMSYSELEVSADDSSVLDQIIDSLTSLASKGGNSGMVSKESNKISLTVGKIQENGTDETRKKAAVLIVGAGRVCRPAAEFLTSVKSLSACPLFGNCMSDEADLADEVEVIVASLYLKDAVAVTQGIPNATAVQLDVADQESLRKYVSQVEVVISLLPASCHVIIAKACIELKKHLVTASYVDDSLSKLEEDAKHAGVTILGEMGLDPGIDHMMAMKMIDEAHAQGGKVRSFTSYCGGLPSPAAANNPLAYKFSWSPAGAIRAGRNPASYRSAGEEIQVSGDGLYDSAVRFRLPDFPAFALEVLPNRNSLVYGDIYGIGDEASTIFRGTLRYEGFSEIMGTLARIGFFDTEAHELLKSSESPTFETFTCKLLGLKKDSSSGSPIGETDIAERIASLGHCKQQETALKTARTIMLLGLHENTIIPSSCQTTFDVVCHRMEERLAYSSEEQDMVLLYHEIEVEFPEAQATEKHQATLLKFGKTEKGITTSAMALTVGIPAAIGARLLLTNKIKTSGILRPIEPEVYIPALDMIQAYGIKLLEKRE